jgi:hypothetical protein
MDSLTLDPKYDKIKISEKMAPNFLGVKETGREFDPGLASKQLEMLDAIKVLLACFVPSFMLL